MDDEVQDTLEREFCPPLEASLVRSLFKDYDTSDGQQFIKLRQLLGELTEEASEQQATAFDSSGTGGFSPHDSQHVHTESSPPSEMASTSNDAATFSTAFSDLNLEDGIADGLEEEIPWDQLGQEARERWLQRMFPAVPRNIVSATLKHNGNMFEASSGELLDYTLMLEEDPDFASRAPIFQKGIDGFAASEFNQHKRKGKRRKRIDISSSTASSATASEVESDASPVVNAWHGGPRSSTQPLVDNKIIPKYRPVDLDSENEPVRPSSSNQLNSADHSRIKAQAFASREAARTASDQAAKAFRRGRSDHLMLGAGAVYAERSRDHLEQSRVLTSAAADALVAQQSTNSSTDLHGVDVSNATRIALTRTRTWWDSLGDSKYLPGGAIRSVDAHSIVTGAGRHSQNGRPKISPAVYKALVNDGWKVNMVPGVITITGRSLKK
ncbi:MAG: hypothetical protein Q9227_002093 [Pyrenula ochraceoflavens]